jgi:hypothetical protein
MRPRAWRRAPGRSRRWVSPLVRRPLRPRGGERLHIRSPPLLSGRSSVLLVGREGPGSSTRRCGCRQMADAPTLQKCRVADTHLVTRLLQAFHAHVACTAPPQASQARQGGGRRRTQSGVVALKEASPQHAPQPPQQRATTSFTAATPRRSACSLADAPPTVTGDASVLVSSWRSARRGPPCCTLCQGDSRHRRTGTRGTWMGVSRGAGTCAWWVRSRRRRSKSSAAGHTCPADAPSTASSNASSATLRHASLIAAMLVTLAPAGRSDCAHESQKDSIIRRAPQSVCVCFAFMCGAWVRCLGGGRARRRRRRQPHSTMRACMSAERLPGHCLMRRHQQRAGGP